MLDLTEAERPLLGAEGLLRSGLLLPPVPRHAGLGMDPVHHDVQVTMRPILVGDDEGLVIGEPEIREEPGGDLAHL